MSKWILLSIVLVMLFAPWIVDALRRLRPERERLMIGAAMRKASVNASRLDRAALVLRLARPCAPVGLAIVSTLACGGTATMTTSARRRSA